MKAMSRVVRGGFPDRQFDVDFWQQQGDDAIFDAAWELVELAEGFNGTNQKLKPKRKQFNPQVSHVQYKVISPLFSVSTMPRDPNRPFSPAILEAEESVNRFHHFSSLLRKSQAAAAAPP